jgi:hypothetical protein
MNNRAIIALITAAVLAISWSIGRGEDYARPIKPVVAGDEAGGEMAPSMIRRGLVTDSPGEIVGYTQMEYQTNGSTGNRCALDFNGGVHFAWTKGIDPPQVRNVYYNYVDSNGNWLVPGQGSMIGQNNGAGFIQLDLTSDNRAGVVYHESMYDYVVYACDAFEGFGIFFYQNPPDMLDYRCYWPYLAIDIDDRIHLVMRELNPPSDPGAIGYTRSEDEGQTWSTLLPVDTIYTYSQSITASPVSNKVAIAYTHSVGPEVEWMNDVYYIESDNGTDWDWENGKINVTEYGDGGDSLFAYTDLAPIYDYNDNLHIIWNAWYASESGVGDTAFLYHYDYGNGIITLMNAREFDMDSECNPGYWTMAIAKMSLGVHQPSGGIFTAYTVFDTSDCSAGGYANGEIFMQYSTDNGQSWSLPENLTNSPTPDCAPGNCDSDHWSSLADRVDDELHIMYINDKDAGGTPQNEGTITDNPVLYLAVPNPLLGGDTGNISGVVATPEGGLRGVPVDLVESGGDPYGSTATDESGAYQFPDVPNGEYTISISVPLGYMAEDESYDIEIEGQDIIVDFDLTEVETVDERRGVGFWKHQLNVYILDKGRARIPEEEFRQYLADIGAHFNNNPVNPIALYAVEQPADPMDSLTAAWELLSAGGRQPMAARAARQLMAVILNVVSLRLHQQTAVAEDGASASQAITYCYDLITDEETDNDETAKDIAEWINDNMMIAAGIIPLSTPDISYRPEPSGGSQYPSSLNFAGCYPNPFNAATSFRYSLSGPGEINISIYNVLGQKVATIFDGTQDGGEHSVTWDASAFPSGVYFARLEAGGQTETIKMLLLK